MGETNKEHLLTGVVEAGQDKVTVENHRDSFAVFVLPCFKSPRETSIVGQVFSQSELAVDVFFLASRVLDGVLGVLVDEALRALGEFSGGFGGPPVLEAPVGVVL